jgi:hypothetical protein
MTVMSVIIVSPKTVSRKGAKKAKTQREFKIPLRLGGFLRDFARILCLRCANYWFCNTLFARDRVFHTGRGARAKVFPTECEISQRH